MVTIAKDLDIALKNIRNTHFAQEEAIKDILVTMGVYTQYDVENITATSTSPVPRIPLSDTSEES